MIEPRLALWIMHQSLSASSMKGKIHPIATCSRATRTTDVGAIVTFHRELCIPLYTHPTLTSCTLLGILDVQAIARRSHETTSAKALDLWRWILRPDPDQSFSRTPLSQVVEDPMRSLRLVPPHSL